MRSRTRRRLTYATSIGVLAALGYSCASTPTPPTTTATPPPVTASPAVAAGVDVCDELPVRRFLDGVEKHARRETFSPGRDAQAWQAALDGMSSSDPFAQGARTAVRAYVQAAGVASSRAFQAGQVRAAAVELVEVCGLAGRYRFDDPRRARPIASKRPKTRKTRTPDVGAESGSCSGGRGSWGRPRSWLGGC